MVGMQAESTNNCWVSCDVKAISEDEDIFQGFCIAVLEGVFAKLEENMAGVTGGVVGQSRANMLYTMGAGLGQIMGQQVCQ